MERLRRARKRSSRSLKAAPDCAARHRRPRHRAGSSDRARGLTHLLRYYGHAITILRTGEDAKHAMDPLIIVDDQHYLHRLHVAQARATLGIAEPDAAQPLIERFDAIWSSAEPGVSATVAGPVTSRATPNQRSADMPNTRRLTRTVLRRRRSSLRARRCRPGTPATCGSDVAANRQWIELLATDRAMTRGERKDRSRLGISAMFAHATSRCRFRAASVRRAPLKRVAGASGGSRQRADRAAEWVPVRGGISADGLQGYTWGYMTIIQARHASTLPAQVSVVLGQGVRRLARRRLPPAAAACRASLARARSRQSLPARRSRSRPTDGPRSTSVIARASTRTERAFSGRARKLSGSALRFARYGRPDAVNMGGPDDAAIRRRRRGDRPHGVRRQAGRAQRRSHGRRTERSSRPSGDLGVTIGLIRRPRRAGSECADGVSCSSPSGNARTPADPRRYVAE